MHALSILYKFELMYRSDGLKPSDRYCSVLLTDVRATILLCALITDNSLLISFASLRFFATLRETHFAMPLLQVASRNV